MAETIFALATGHGRAGIAIIRISGPEAASALRQLSGEPLPRPRHAARRNYQEPDGQSIDRGLALYFPAPASFTGEDVVELHVHAGRAVLNALTAALAGQPGLRPAEPGEFTRRAFEHGKLDLTQAEGLGDLIAAETEAQRRQALRQLDGELGRIYDGWRGRLVRVLAHLEADIDFPDEDLPPGLAVAARAEIEALAGAIGAHLADHRRSERLRDGLSIAILGPPNVGKSSLLNYLAGRDAAIVSDIAGTTRDVIEVRLDLGGYPVLLADTAGLRETVDAIETEGVRRALARAAEADLRIRMFDAADWPAGFDAAEFDQDTILLLNKVDRRAGGPIEAPPGVKLWPVSVRTGAGMPAFLDALTELARDRIGLTGAAGITRVRHRQALEDCVAALRRALQAPAAELAAEDLRLAVRALGRITGRVDVEDILDVVFRDFCIGK